VLCRFNSLSHQAPVTDGVPAVYDTKRASANENRTQAVKPRDPKMEWVVKRRSDGSRHITRR